MARQPAYEICHAACPERTVAANLQHSLQQGLQQLLQLPGSLLLPLQRRSGRCRIALLGAAAAACEHAYEIRAAIVQLAGLIQQQGQSGRVADEAQQPLPEGQQACAQLARPLQSLLPWQVGCGVDRLQAQVQEPRQLSLQVAALLQTCEVALQLALRMREKRCNSAAKPCSKVEAAT